MKGFKKVVALLQVALLLVTMLPIMSLSNTAEVRGAVSGIVNGETYMIVSAYNGKAITQTDLSTFYADCVVWNTDAMSNLARWTVKESGAYYTFTNSVSGKSMKIDGSSANGSNVDLNGNDNSNNYKWKLVPITTGTYAGCFYIVSAVQNSAGQDECAEIISDEDKKDSDGATVRLWTKAASVEYEPRQIWRLVQSDVEEQTFTETMSDTALQAFKNKYFVYDSSTGYNSLGDGFWGTAEVMESMLDGYETTGKAVYKEMFVGTYNAFIKRNGDYWTSNDFNDDIAWAVLDSVRAYLLFGDQTYLDIAKKNYDFMYARATEGRTDGLLRWSHEDGRGDGTNSCINGPATVAACYLAIATGDDSYYTKAKGIFDAWRNSAMYVREGDDAGHVWDTASNSWRSTYNQGTFIGAATMLYERYGIEQYYTDACNAMKNTMNLCNNINGMCILKEENTNSGDLSGMRGILMRYMRRFIVDFDSEEYLSFFQDNAQIAWMNRNSQNIMQCSWQKKTAEEVTWDSFAAYNAISLMANMPTYSDSIVRDAYSVIEAEDMDYCKGLISENSTGTSGGRSLGGVQNNHYTAYYNVDFGSAGASKVTFKYSRSPERDGAKGTIEIRLGSKDGTLIGTASLDNTSSWSDWKEITVDITKTTGLQNIYLVYKADTSYVCNLDYFTFTEAIEYKDAFRTIEAESHDANEGIINDSDPGNIGGTNDGDWVRYDYVNFTKTAKSISFNYAVQGKDAGGKVLVYLDSMDNAPVCEAELGETAYDNWRTYVVDKIDLTTPVESGTHSVYFKFVTDAGKSYVANIDSFSFSELSHNEYSNLVDVLGFQISTITGGSRVIGSVEPTIFNHKVSKWGFVYGLASANGTDYGISEEEMFVGANNKYIVSYDSTSIGTATVKMGQSDTATYFVRTMTYGGNNAIAYSAQYKVRAYAVLDDGTYVYSDVSDYSVFMVAKHLYDNTMMNTPAAHDYLYNNILKVVDSTYIEIDYDWNNVIIKP